MKKVKLIHQEENSDCIEILKDAIVEEKELKKFHIDKHTLLQNLPEGIVNSFLDYIADFSLKQKQLLLEMTKEGTIALNCWDDDDETISEAHRLKLKEESKKSQQQFKGLFDELDEMDVPF